MIDLTTTDPALAAALREGVEIEVRGVMHTVAEVVIREDGATVARLRSPRDQPELIESGPVRIMALEDIDDSEYPVRGAGGRVERHMVTLAAGEEATVPGRFARLLVGLGKAEVVG